jgi:kinesin light chain
MLYKQILTRAHEQKFGTINAGNKPIWQIAEEREANKDKHVDTGTYHENNGELQKAMNVDKYVCQLKISSLQS